MKFNFTLSVVKPVHNSLATSSLSSRFVTDGAKL